MKSKKKKKKVNYKKERAILSDVLPFEIPLTFTNRFFYEFLVSNRIQIEGGELVWNSGSSIIDEIIYLIFNVRRGAKEKFNIKDDLRTVPFGFKVNHGEQDFRELKLVHPKNQVDIVGFYESYKESILYYSSLSKFSIRRPSRISKFVFHRDQTHSKRVSFDEDTHEEEEKEYESLKSYFVYKDYSNIYKFFESNKYHLAEKKYNKMIRFDISKCFDSIYTHSISWAVLRKDLVKDHINDSNGTFPGKFDVLMQNLNYGETNGLVVGPEISRIFAELVLQAIDKNVVKRLSVKDIHFGRDYEIFRYVDDHFLFCNDSKILDIVLQETRICLKEYNLYFNEAKVERIEKPLITKLSIAKSKILSLLNVHLNSEIKEVQFNTGEVKYKGNFYLSSTRLITDFKTALFESNVGYRDVMNFTLSLLERKLVVQLKKYDKISPEYKNPDALIGLFVEVIEFAFFIYTVSPRVNATIKLCRVLRVIIDKIQDKDFASIASKHLVFKKIFDEVNFVLVKYRMYDHAQVETLYLIVVLSELGREYWLSVESLSSYFNISFDNVWHFRTNLNYFSITVLLFYMKNKIRYTSLKEALLEHVKDRFEDLNSKNIKNDAERMFMMLDLISCPYVDYNFKGHLLTMFGVDVAYHSDIISFKQCWFTKWHDFDFGKELDAKIGKDVY